MNGVYINIYYDGYDRHGNTVIRVYHAHTDVDKEFCDSMRNPHSKASHQRQRRWQRQYYS